MCNNEPKKWVKTSIAAAALLTGISLALPVRAEILAPSCDAPLDLIRLANPLPHVAHKLATGEPITIVALGSSSTAGAGASSATTTYPSQLAIELHRHFPKASITVLNRGVGGEEIPDMLARFDSAVLTAKPDLINFARSVLTSC